MAFERRVLTRYDASTTGFDRGTRRVDQQLARLQRTADTRLGAIDRRFERAGRAARRFGAALAGLASVAALRRLDAGIRNALSSLDNIDKTASRLGLTTTALQELRSAADQSGVSVGTFDMAMQRFGRRIAEARQGTGAAKGVIKEMGIALVDASGNARHIEDVLADVSNKMSEMTNQTDMNRIAMKLFDSEGVALVNMLRDGAAGMEVMRQRARELGIVIDEDLIRRSVKANDELALISKVIESQMTVALAELGPTLVSLSQFFADLATAVSGGEDSIIDLAAALQALAVGSAVVAGGRGIGAVTAAIREGTAARTAAVRESQALVASTQREVQARRLALATLQRETAQRVASAAGIKNVEAANRRLASARTALTAAETQAATATNALAVAQGRLSAATRITAGAMTALRGAMAFIGGVPGLLFAAAAAAIYFSDSLVDMGSAADRAERAFQEFDDAVQKLRSTEARLASDTEALTAANRRLQTAIEGQQTAAVDTARIEIDAINRRIAKNLELKATYEAIIRGQLAVAEGELLPARSEFQRNFSMTVSERFGFDTVAAMQGRPVRGISEEEQARRLEERRARVVAEQDAGKVLSAEDHAFLKASGKLEELELRAIGAREALEKLGEPIAVELPGGAGGGGGGSATDKEKKALEELMAAADKRALQIINEQELLRAGSERERYYLEERQRLLNEAGDKGLILDPAFVEDQSLAISELTVQLENLRSAKELITEVTESQLTVEEKIVAANEKLADLLPQIIALTGDEAEARRFLAEAQEMSAEAIRKTAGGTDELARGLSEVADRFTNAIQQADSFADALKRIGIELLNIAAQGLAGQGPLGGLLGDVLPGLLGSGLAPSSSPVPAPRPFDTGGWTGGNRRDIRGVVHGEEYVVRAGPARRHLPLLEAINRGVPGFADGGFVSPVVPNVPRAALSGIGSSVKIEEHIHNHSSEEVRTQTRSGADGRIIREIIIGTLNEDIANRGPVSRSMQGAFGLKRGGVS